MSFDGKGSLGKLSLSFEPSAFVHDRKTDKKNCLTDNNNDHDESSCSHTMDVEPNISEPDPSDNMIQEKLSKKCFCTQNKSKSSGFAYLQNMNTIVRIRLFFELCLFSKPVSNKNFLFFHTAKKKVFFSI